MFDAIDIEVLLADLGDLGEHAEGVVWRGCRALKVEEVLKAGERLGARQDRRRSHGGRRHGEVGERGERSAHEWSQFGSREFRGGV